MTVTKQKSVAAAYFYKNKYSDLLNDLHNMKEYFAEIVVVNLIPENTIESSDKDLRVINTSKTDLKGIFTELLKFNFTSDYLLLLEDNETPVIKGDLINLANPAYQIMIKPARSEVHNFEEEIFTVPEKRLISLNFKHIREFTENPDLFFSAATETLSPEIFFINKKETDYNFEFLKLEEIKANKEKFTLFSGIVNFYKESEKAESYLKEILSLSENKSYREVALMLLLKLNNRKLEFEKTIDLQEHYFSEDMTNPFCFIYYALAMKETGGSRAALRNFHKAIKLREKLPFIFNNSDINWKLYKSIADIFESLNRVSSAEKYYNFADQCLTDRKSPEVLYNLAKIKFINNHYSESYKLYLKLFEQEKIPSNLLREVKTSFLNLLLYLSYKEEFTDILSKEVFDKPADISKIADSFYINGDYESALQLYLLLANRFGTESRLLFKLGYICSRLKLLEQGAQYFEKYLELNPDDLDAINNIAFLYLNMERPDEAEKYYLKILEKNSFSFEANLYLAMIYISREDKEKASRYIDRARTLNPVSPEIIKLYQIYKSEFN